MNLHALVAMAPTLRLQTDRLVLRRLRDADVATLVAHEQDRRIMQWIRDPEPLTAIRDRVRGLLADWTGADGQWLALGIEPKGAAAIAGIVVGRVTAAIHETMEIGYRLTTEVHRRGYGFETCTRLLDLLFGEIAVHKVTALCTTENEPSWRLMEKLGMQREARLREYTRLGGRWRDEFVYGLLAREWRDRDRDAAT